LAGDANVLPLSVILSAANVNDATMLEAVLDDIPPIRMPTGRRRRRSGKVHANKAYDHRRLRIALHRIESSARLGRHRWRIKWTGAWLGGFGRLRTCKGALLRTRLRLAMLLLSDLPQRLQQPW
jgi:hypothetical protein